MPNGAHASATYGSHISPNHRRTRKSHKLRNTLLIVLLALVAFAAAASVAGVKFYKEAMQVKDHETQAVTLIQQVKDLQSFKDPDAVANVLPQLQSHTSAARSIAETDLWNFAAKLPWIGDDVKSVQGMTQIVDDLSQQTLPKLSDVVKGLLGANFSSGKGQVNLQPVVDAQGNFATVNEEVQSLAQQFDALPTPHISAVRSAYDQASSQFSTISTQLDQINSTLQALPQFLGANGSRTYIIVASTQSESRSGGGLVGSLGSFTADHGNIAIGDFHPNGTFIPIGMNFATDSEQEFFSAPLDMSFDVRDVLAAPDFSRAARQINRIWSASAYGSNADGVMGIDPVFVQEMIRISGDVTLPNGQVLTGDNTAEFLLNGIYKTVPVSQQDAYFEYVAKQAMNNVFSNLNLSKMLSMSQMMGQLAEGRHLYLYSFHDDEAAHFQDAGLSKDTPNNEEKPEVGIYTNQMNPSKLDWYVHKTTEIKEAGTGSDGSRTYHVRYTMTNTLTAKEAQSLTSYIVSGDHDDLGALGESVDKMLFYAPAGGTLTNLHVASGNGSTPETATMDDKQLFTSIARLSPGATVVYEFDVTTSSKATQRLGIDQTPMGWLDNGVTYSN